MSAGTAGYEDAKGVRNQIRFQKQLTAIIERCKPDEIAIIGMGNKERGDDNAGIIIADVLRKTYPETFFSETDKPVESHVFRILENNTLKTLLFLDTAHFNGQPGEVRLFDIHSISRIAPAISTHQISLSMLMNILQEKNIASYLVGIQPRNTELMQPLSPELRETVDELIRFFQNMKKKS